MINIFLKNCKIMNNKAALQMPLSMGSEPLIKRVFAFQCKIYLIQSSI